MTANDDYFSNHARARRFPWSLYHAPLERDLLKFLTVTSERFPNGRVLVVGCGLLHEIDQAPPGLVYEVADIDERAVAAVLARNDHRIVAGHVVAPETALDVALSTAITDHGGYAAIYAKEVVEHVLAWPLWLVGLRRALLPGGSLWLSTPNYGEPWLPALESTALELVARRDGFSRKHIHPTRFSRASLERGLHGAGFAEVRTKVPTPRFAITAWASL